MGYEWYIAGPFLAILILLILAFVYIKVSMGRFNSKERMDGKTVIVTGANSGIGYETALDLAGRGARVILACRTQSKADEAKDKIVAATGNTNVHVRLVDMMSFDSIRRFASEILANEEHIHVLVNNAGAGGLGSTKTADGFIPGIQVNHYSPFLLTNLLLGRLKQSAPSRVVFVSSATHWFASFDVEDINQDNRKSHSEFKTYSNVKLLNILTSNELAMRMSGTDVTSNSLHPGVVKTEFFRKSHILKIFMTYTIGLFSKTSKQGAQTTIRLAVDPQLKNTTGKYFTDCTEAMTSSTAANAAIAKKAWDFSEKAVQLKETEKYYNKTV